MASLDELIVQCQQAIDQIEQAISTVSAAENEAGELQAQFASLGADAQASHLAGIKDGADSWRVQLLDVLGAGKELVTQVEAAKG
jgi:hypothetical protein